MVETKEQEELNESIKISTRTKKRLDDFKIIDRETYNDAIKRALDQKEKI